MRYIKMVTLWEKLMTAGMGKSWENTGKAQESSC